MKEFTKIIDKASIWGELYLPVMSKLNSGNELKVVLFVSCNCGNLVINNLSAFEQNHPELLNVVGVVTDDPVDPNARISIKKRIWSQFSGQERIELKNQIVETCMNIGIPCYTGAVKTDYFRHIYQSWDPEVLIMFCFGQKLDSFLYDFPPRGAYNLHPSDLPKQIGAGTQPFQVAMRNGLKTSPLVIHQITEQIDMGPIVGVSPPINICLKDGTYPISLLTLLDKITSLGGWMSTQLISDIIGLKLKGEPGPLKWIDFAKELPDEIKQFLMMPATNDLTERYIVPLHPQLMT